MRGELTQPLIESLGFNGGIAYLRVTGASGTPAVVALDLSTATLLGPTQHGYPVQDRGVVESIPCLYFVGLLFLRSLSSALLGGVGRDAEHIAELIASARPRPQQPDQDTPNRKGITP